MKIEAYLGHDWRSRMAARILKDLQLYFAKEYGLKINVELTEIMVGDSDEESFLPLILIEGEAFSEGRVPSMEELVDALFERMAAGLRTSFLRFPSLGETA